jgi:hypothetical protein
MTYTVLHGHGSFYWKKNDFNSTEWIGLLQDLVTWHTWFFSLSFSVLSQRWKRVPRPQGGFNLLNSERFLQIYIFCLFYRVCRFTQQIVQNVLKKIVLTKCFSLLNFYVVNIKYNWVRLLVNIKYSWVRLLHFRLRSHIKNSRFVSRGFKTPRNERKHEAAGRQN